MTIPIAFTKASGAGNDFILVNNIAGGLRVDFAQLARTVCDRHFGVGGDGLLVLNKSSRADFTMMYFNADGSFGGMCGNGGRCIARFAFMLGIAGRTQRFEALDHLYDAEVGEASVRLHMKDTSGLKGDLTLGAGGRILKGSFIDTGAPHVVIFDEGLDRLDVMGLGSAVRHDAQFAPAGANVNFARIRDGSTVEIRTYERGVESETLACGTGSVASALVSSALHALRSPVSVLVKSGETLQVHFRMRDRIWTEIFLEGSAHMLFQGNILYSEKESTIRPIS